LKSSCCRDPETSDVFPRKRSPLGRGETGIAKTSIRSVIVTDVDLYGRSFEFNGGCDPGEGSVAGRIDHLHKNVLVDLAAATDLG
jgi:hypothetical protein